MLIWIGIALAAIVVVILLVRVRRPPQKAQKPPSLQVVEPEVSHRLLETRPLDAQSRDGYMQAWESVQPRFADDPEIALRETDRILQRVMSECGYPTGDFGRVSEQVTSEQLGVLENYRVGHRITVKGETTMLEAHEIERARAAFRDAFERLVADSLKGLAAP
jgi:hypothetical protein